MFRNVFAYGRRNPELIVGVAMLLLLVLFWIIGPLFIDVKKATPLSTMPDMPPGKGYPLGTESVGRDMLAILLLGTRYSFQIGLIAGTVGLTLGTLLGFTAGYFGGTVDTIIRGAADVGLTIPALAVLVVVASVIQQLLTPTLMALIIASLAWMWPTRTIRSQVLSMRERPYIEIARLSGLNDVQIIFKEILPNLLPYLAASFVGAVSSGLLAAIGLEALGLGPQTEPTLGMTIFWGMYYGALLRGMWWWWALPIVAIAWVFISLFMVSSGLDEIANPRLRRAQ